MKNIVRKLIFNVGYGFVCLGWWIVDKTFGETYAKTSSLCISNGKTTYRVDYNRGNAE